METSDPCIFQQNPNLAYYDGFVFVHVTLVVIPFFPCFHGHFSLMKLACLIELSQLICSDPAISLSGVGF